MIAIIEASIWPGISYLHIAGTFLKNFVEIANFVVG